MKTANDTVTGELLPNHDLAGEVLGTVNKNAERAKRFRERHGLAAMTVNIDAAVLAGFNEWYDKPANKAKYPKKGDAIAHLIKTQLLRKR